ncbi:MAG: hypothetical protein AABY26_01020, partial [Nanoarchaeota archaeon]
MKFTKSSSFFAVVLLILLLSSSAWAISEVKITPVKDTITVLETASFKINLTNLLGEAQKYTLFSLELGTFIVEPADKVNTITLASGESRLVEVTVKPSEKITPGIYLVSLSIDGDKGDALEEKLKVYINPTLPAQYAPALSVKVDISEKVDPREPILIKLYLSNQNSLNLTGVRVKLQSEMPEFNKVATIDIPPLGKKELEFSITPNPVQQPKVYILKFGFERFGEDFKVVEQLLEIVSLLPAFSVVEEEAKNVYLKVYKRYTIKNPGNVLNTQEAKVPVSFLQGLLTQEVQGKVTV